MGTKTGTFHKHFQHYLGIGSVSLGFLYIFLVTFIPIPVQNVRFADTVLGVVIGTIITTVYQYFFGSSQGSVDKQKALESKIQNTTENE